MPTDRQLRDLVSLVRRRYPAWDGFAHPPFVADEVDYKRTAVARVTTELSATAVDAWLAAGDATALLDTVRRLAHATNLLYLAVPSAGDLALLHHPRLQPAEFAHAFRRLLHGEAATSDRLQTFADYLDHAGLPNRWPFPTYFLFLTHPESDYFVKPSVARWFLQFMGLPDVYRSTPSASGYEILREQVQLLFHDLAAYEPTDLIDIQSLIWVAARESRARTGGLDRRAQVDLGVPDENTEPLTYDVTPATAILRDAPDAPYTLDQMAVDTAVPTDTLARWARAVARKGQAILYGPPGTGKTYLAEHLARHLVGDGDGFTTLLQLHPAYTYEEFIQGLRPVVDEDGRLHYQWVDGRFLTFCRRAAAVEGVCVLILDEINRADIAAVLGELMYLLEYRDRTIPLAGGHPFAIPANVRLIGTMNTADRSIALVDHALRRRFAFIHIPPLYEVLDHFHAGAAPVAALIALLRDVNDAIADPHYALGIAPFLRLDLAAELPDIWQVEIEPYLEEYFFDQTNQVARFRWTAVRDRIFPSE